MLKLIAHSKLNSNALLMIIVGRADPPEGIALFSVHSTGTTRWNLTLDPVANRAPLAEVPAQ